MEQEALSKSEDSLGQRGRVQVLQREDCRLVLLNGSDPLDSSYDRHLHTKAGEVTLTVPKLRTLPFETAVIERYQRRESSVEEALIEMYLAGVSVRRVEDITQALWGTRVSASTVSDLNQKIYGNINEWRERPLVVIKRSRNR